MLIICDWPKIETEIFHKMLIFIECVRPDFILSISFNLFNLVCKNYFDANNSTLLNQLLQFLKK